MRKKIVAVVLCVVFAGVAASGLLAAEKKSVRVNAREMVKNPAKVLGTLLPILKGGAKVQVPSLEANTGKLIVKPTEEIVIPKPSTGD